MENSLVAHSINGDVEKTADIKLLQTSFAKMVLSDTVKKGLEFAGFKNPTDLQANAIPIGITGIDLLIQSKSGTGKTIIFCTILLELLKPNIQEPQSLIIVPTREIAVQIKDILNKIGRYYPGFLAVSVIGGVEINDDRKNLRGAKIIVGTPGRVLHLIKNRILNTSSINNLILDEADKLMTQTFTLDIQQIFSNLPKTKQVIACSATFYKDLDVQLSKFMKNPLLLSTEKQTTSLLGIKQFSIEIPEEKISIIEIQSKVETLIKFFTKIPFKQCLVFVNSQAKADSYRNCLENEGWSCECLTGAQDQKTRLEMFRKFKNFKTRIIISTDLASRGIDSENVNLVINLEVPTDEATYLHRIGRAGRFGSHGIAITFVSSKFERQKFSKIMKKIRMDIKVLKYPINSTHNLYDFANIGKDPPVLESLNCEENSFKRNENENNKEIYENINKNGYKVEHENIEDQKTVSIESEKSNIDSISSNGNHDNSIEVNCNTFEGQTFTHNAKAKQMALAHSLIGSLIDKKSSSEQKKINFFDDYNISVHQYCDEKVESDKEISNPSLIYTNVPEEDKNLTQSERHENVFTSFENFSKDLDDTLKTSPNEPTPSCSYDTNLPKQIHEEHNDEVIKSRSNSFSSNAESSSDSESAASSGFDEKTTSEKSSGIVSSSNIDTESEDSDDNFDDNVNSEMHEDNNSLKYDNSESDESSSCENDCAPVTYRNQQTRWTELYFNQISYIQDYVEYLEYVKKKSNINFF